MSRAGNLFSNWRNAHKQQEEQQHAHKAALYKMNIFSLVPQMVAAIAVVYKNR